jgi:hypothetical protein
MGARKREAEEVVYLSSFANTMVAFDGIAKESRHGILPYKPEHFKNGKLVIQPNKDYGNRRGLGRDIIKRMDDHPKNRENNGTLFYKVDQNAMDVIEYQMGTLVAREPSGGVTKAIQKQLSELYKAAQEGYEKSQHDIMVDEIGVVFDMFSVKGILKPEKTHDQMRVRSRLIEFFAVLEERDIWTPPKSK